MDLINLLKEIRDAWGWVGITPSRIVDENDFGNLLIEDDSGRYWRLCPEEVFCDLIANNSEELDVIRNHDDFATDWDMWALVERAKRRIGPLTEGQKYCLVIPGILGGAYDISNVKAVPLVELIRWSGDLGKQIRDLPDGAEVELKVID